MSKKVYAFLAEGFEEIEAITPIDVLRRAGAEVVTVSISNEANVVGAHGISIMADELISNIDTSDADLFFLPGGVPGTPNLAASEILAQKLKVANAEGKTISAICAAPSVLGGLGLLEGKEAICYPGWEDKLLGATISAKSVAVSENIITGKGVGAAMKFALTLVETLYSKNLADDLAKKMVVE